MGSCNPLYLVVVRASSRVQIFHLNAICPWIGDYTKVCAIASTSKAAAALGWRVSRGA
jgi:hypothetical protein